MAPERGHSDGAVDGGDHGHADVHGAGVDRGYDVDVRVDGDGGRGECDGCGGRDHPGGQRPADGERGRRPDGDGRHGGDAGGEWHGSGGGAAKLRVAPERGQSDGAVDGGDHGDADVHGPGVDRGDAADV